MFTFVLITSILSLMITCIVIKTWLNCYKVIWGVYYADKVDTLFVLFGFFSLYKLFPAFICANNTTIS